MTYKINVMDCGVCLEALGCASFDKNADVDPDSVHRFSCGHAFHASCAIRSVLVSRRCPSCRASLNAKDSDTESEDLPVIIHTHPSAASDVRMNSDITMGRVRSTSADVQRERRVFRMMVAEYNRLHDRMRHRRRAALQEALGAFRRRHYANCDQAIVRLQIHLERVRHAEAKAWAEIEGSVPSGDAWEQYLSIDATEFVGLSSRRSENMLDRRFWSLR